MKMEEKIFFYMHPRLDLKNKNLKNTSQPVIIEKQIQYHFFNKMFTSFWWLWLIFFETLFFTMFWKIYQNEHLDSRYILYLFLDTYIIYHKPKKEPAFTQNFSFLLMRYCTGHLKIICVSKWKYFMKYWTC